MIYFIFRLRIATYKANVLHIAVKQGQALSKSRTARTAKWATDHQINHGARLKSAVVPALIKLRQARLKVLPYEITNYKASRRNAWLISQHFEPMAQPKAWT